MNREEKPAASQKRDTSEGSKKLPITAELILAQELGCLLGKHLAKRWSGLSTNRARIVDDQHR
jgi:hypothetical protein